MSPNKIHTHKREWESFCFTSTEARLLIRDGDGGGGGGRKGEEEGGGEREKMKARSQAPSRKTKDGVDRRQKNKNVKAVSPRYCAATSVLRNCCAGQRHNIKGLKERCLLGQNTTCEFSG